MECVALNKVHMAGSSHMSIPQKVVNAFPTIYIDLQIKWSKIDFFFLCNWFSSLEKSRFIKLKKKYGSAQSVILFFFHKHA